MGCGWGKVNSGKQMCSVVRSKPGTGTYHSDHIPHLEAWGIGDVVNLQLCFHGRKGEWTWVYILKSLPIL